MKLKSFSIKKATLGLGTSLLMWVPVANAQQIEDIIVTAQKREGDLQKTPIAITAFSAESIEQNRIESVSDVAVRTPGLVYSQLEGETTISLRGVGMSITGLGGEPAVAAYQDGVYMGPSLTMSMPSFDLERVEVLRGPQGTLYGRNATGGAINFITRSPQYDPELNLAVGYGSFDHVKLEAGATGGLSDKIAVRGSVIYDDRAKGYRINSLTGRHVKGEESLSLNISALLEPTENLRITLRGNSITRKSGGGQWELIQLAPSVSSMVSPANTAGFFANPDFPDDSLGGKSWADYYELDFPVATTGTTARNPKDRLVGQNMDNWSKYKMKSASGTLEWDLGDVQLKSITAVRDIKWHMQNDQDGSDLTIFHHLRDDNVEIWTQEFNLSGNSINDRLKWLLGGYWYREKSSSSLFADQSDLQLFYESLVGMVTHNAPLNDGDLKVLNADNPLGQGVGLQKGLNQAAPFMSFFMTQRAKSLALFGEAKYEVTDDFALTVGGRWTHDKKNFVRNVTSNWLALLDPTAVVLNEGVRQGWKEVTGNIIAEYMVSPHTMVFGKIARGYKGGGINAGKGGSSFDPEIIWAYEAGVKSRIFDGQMQVNLAGFYYDYKDIQILRYDQTGTAVDNAAAAKILGAELEVILAPRVLSGFQLSGSMGYLDAKYGHALFADPVNEGDPIDIDGNRLIQAPKWKASLAAEYSFDTKVGQIKLMADANYSSSYYFDVFEAALPNQGGLKQPKYTIMNARAAWSPTPDYQLMLFAENITKKIYAETRTATPLTGGVFGSYSAPRTFGVRLSGKFY